jgi:phosphoribosylglycinamide formyltransferase
MIHYVISEVDRGEPIVIRKIKCKTPESLDELKERVHSHEHELILEGTAMAIHNLWEKRSKSLT